MDLTTIYADSRAEPVPALTNLGIRFARWADLMRFLPADFPHLASRLGERFGVTRFNPTGNRDSFAKHHLDIREPASAKPTARQALAPPEFHIADTPTRFLNSSYSSLIGILSPTIGGR
jgi:hypothetical protein